LNKLLIVSTLILSLTACGRQSPVAETTVAETTAASPPLHSGLLLEYMNTEVRPGDDFHAFVNGKWIAETDIPADKPSYGISYMLHEESQEQVRNIIEESAAGDFAPGSDEQKVGALFSSYMDMDRRNQLGAAPMEAEWEKIDALANRADLAVYFAEANKLGFNMPFALAQYVDFKNPNTYMMYTWQGGLGLPDREFYFLDDEKSKSIREAYVEHVATMLKMAGLASGESAAETIMALESRMAAEHMHKEKTRDMVALYNKVPTAELADLMPGFGWDAYLEAANIANIDGVVVTQVEHMKSLDQIIADTPLDDWKTFLKWKSLNARGSLLSAEIDRQNFAFYSSTLRGVEEQPPRWRRAVNIVNGNLGEVVGRVYVSRHFPPEAKAKMQQLVDNLVAAYEISIRELDWMGPETRDEALAKLSKFTPKIGYPDEWRDYSALEVRRDDLVGNMDRAALVDYQRQIDRQASPVDRSEWQMTPQTVNAYYNPPLNEIVFPAAILQPPFFDMHADDAVNYGSIGAVIGHEIGHGFDDSGSTFDGDGVLRNWWTDSDRDEFKNRTNKLVDQYSAFKPFDDLNVNGEFTLGENIGDLGGLSIALLAYRISLGDVPAPEMDGFTGQQRVFLGYAQSWRSKSREEALRHQINTDPHSPAEYRVNGVVRNVPEFYEAFGVEDTDSLYLAPDQRVKIW
jgi:putative endopeptidase